jgi:deferrochelatase/peroxidase EfeB
MAGGTYQVYRRVRMITRTWDESVLSEQENVMGRRRATGAPFGGTREHDPVRSELLPATSHVRLANPRTGQASEDERILRRGYSFHDGLAADYFPHYAIVAWIADVEVHRTERYI